jgi:hypothetical protein
VNTLELFVSNSQFRSCVGHFLRHSKKKPTKQKMSYRGDRGNGGDQPPTKVKKVMVQPIVSFDKLNFRFDYVCILCSSPHAELFITHAP